MRTCHPKDIHPLVTLANYHEVRGVRAWGGRTIHDMELILAVDGAFEYFDDVDGLVRHEPGQVLVIPPDRFHLYRVAEDCPKAFFSCIHMEPLAGRRLAEGCYRLSPAPRRLTDVSDDADLPELFRRAAVAFGGYGRYREELVSTIVKEIWLHLASHWAEPQGAETPGRTREMVRYLRKRLAEHPTRQDLADAFGLTPQYVNYLFRRELGTTPTKFVHRECVLRAYRLLREEGLSVQEAAERVGFDDPFHFSRVFKRVLGVPPSRI